MASSLSRRRKIYDFKTRADELVNHGRQPVYWRLHEQLYLQSEGTMSIWVNGRCVMRSPIAKPCNFGDTIKIKLLTREPGNLGWAVILMHHRLFFMGDLDDTQFQPISKILLMTQWYHWVLIIKQI